MDSDISYSASRDDDAPQPTEEHLASVTLANSDDEPPAHHESNGVVGGSVNRSTELAIEEPVRRCSVHVDEVTEAGESSGHAVVWGRNVSDTEMDGPSSPSSSGYAGERGSSSATSVSARDNIFGHEIEEMRNDDTVDVISGSQTSWIPGKRHDDEVLVVEMFMEILKSFDARI